MPLGFERLNERTQRPNAFINFIKPLPTSAPQDQTIAKDFLERIAAQCYPVMKKDYVSVMALEEYPPNPEFLGRNFNAGEVIQLVLKDKAGRWLSFKFVQMVMMHELAHCKQMNHSRYFWQVRNKYADHMKELWTKRYEGEGLWGRGQNLTSGDFEHDRMPDNADIPEHLCGGTYRRSRGRKRKRGQAGGDQPKLTYAERQQKRIARKFGAHGEGHGLGEDELVRGALEQGKRSSGKPRVAGSKRGRELRANAALARFEAAKQQQKREQEAPETTPELEDDDGSETESDDDYGDGLAIMDTLEMIKDQRGRDLYRVCGDEGDEVEGGQNEMDELMQMGKGLKTASSTNGVKTDSNTYEQQKPQEDSETGSEPEEDQVRSSKAPPKMSQDAKNKKQPPVDNTPSTNSKPTESQSIADTIAKPSIESMEPVAEASSNVLACPICSLENEPGSQTCMACSHVLKPSLMPNHWRCKSEQCKGSKYINAGDAGRCMLCGSQKPVAQTKPMGVIDANVLRWD